MTALTRIKNNQIYDSTIYANAKIVPGSIVGSLFNSNITVTSDFLITGNLTVLGNSTVSTVASTNTFVNDPLIVMNNAFAGTNTYDLGHVFNRGSATSTAFTWNEASDEFRLTYTTETGSTYGAINLTSYANVHVGNLITEYDIGARNAILSSTDDSNSASTGALQIAGGVGIAKDLFIGGGDITTDQSTFNIFDSGTEIINIGREATTITIGSTTGTANIRNANIYFPNATDFYTGQLGVNFANVRTETLSIGGDATDILLGSLSGVTSIRNDFFDIYGNANIKSTLGTTDQYTGALVVRGGAGIVENLNVGGYANINATTNATNYQTGALVVHGGAGFAKDVYINGNLYVANVYSTTNTILTVNSPLLYLQQSEANTYPYSYDIGFFSAFTGGPANTYVHTGLVRDNDDQLWKLFSNVAEPGAGSVDFSDIVWDSLKLGNIIVTGPTMSNSYATGAIQINGGLGALGNISIGTGYGLCIGGDLKGNVTFPRSIVDVTNDANTFARFTLQNLSTGTYASSEFVAVANNGDVTGIANSGQGNAMAAFGIANEAFDRLDNPIKRNDGFLYVNGGANGGNLILSAGAQDVVIANNLNVDEVAARFLNAEQTMHIYYDTGDDLSGNLAALVVDGGVSVKKGMHIWHGAVFNHGRYNMSQEDPDGQGNVALGVRAVNCEHFIFADAGWQSLTINGPSAGEFQPNVTHGSTFTVNSNDSIVIPVGTTAQRPGSSGNVDVAGMLRLNSTTSNLEYYDGSVWQVAGSVFTVISDRQWYASTGNPYGNVDGSNATFTLQSDASTAGVIVTINGVVQIPVVAYNVSGSTLTFTEPPAEGDYIDVRVLTTTAAITQLSSANGYNQAFADNDGVSFWTGTSNTVKRTEIVPDGNVKMYVSRTAYDIPSTNAPSTSAVLIDQFNTSTYSTAKYIVQVKNGANKLESMEALVVSEDGNASVVTYAIVNSHGTAMGTLSANVVSGNCRLYYTSSSLSNSNVKVVSTYIA